MVVKVLVMIIFSWCTSSRTSWHCYGHWNAVELVDNVEMRHVEVHVDTNTLIASILLLLFFFCVVFLELEL